MANGVLSKGIELKEGTVATGSATQTYPNTVLNIQEIPDLGGISESVEITTLADEAHMYMNGIKDYGDSLDFTCLYQTSGSSATEFAFDELNDLGTVSEYAWQVGIPDGDQGAISTTATFKGTCSVKINSVGTNAPLTFTLSIKPTSKITYTIV